MKLYLVRHGERDKGANFDRLVPEGIKQSEKVGRWFKNKRIDVVYCSPQNRAQQTLNEMIPYLGNEVEIKISNRIRQQGSPEEVGKEMIKKLEIKKETNEATTRRANRFLKYLLKKYEKESIIIVTHKMFITFLVSSLLDLDSFKVKIPTGSITMLDFNDNWNLIRKSIGKKV